MECLRYFSLFDVVSGVVGRPAPSPFKLIKALLGSTKAEIPVEQRQGAIKVLGMLAQDSADVLDGKIELLLKVGLGKRGLVWEEDEGELNLSLE